MRKSLFTVLGTAAAIGAALLITTAASAAPHARAAPAAPCTTPSPTSCDTTVTFTVSSGAISISAPTGAGLSTAGTGTSASGTVGPVVVTDNRAVDNGTWTAQASSSAFTLGTVNTPSANETIPVTDASYVPGAITTTGTTGTITAVPSTITLSGTPQTVVASAVTGNNIASWNPTETVTVPTNVVAGGYTSTLTESLL